MKIKRFIGGMLESNGYVIYQQDGGDCYIIDPGYRPKVFIEFVREHDLNLCGILLTHYHYDHVGAVERIREAFGCRVYLHTGDCDPYGKPVDVYLEDGDVIDLEGESIVVISTPGHTKGSVCFLSQKSKVCFTGDTVFPADLGRTDFEGGSPEEMRDSILNKANQWSNDITIYPGHENDCTMKQVRRNNREFLDIIEGK